MPSLVWSRVGGLPALSAPDFRSLLLEGCLRLAADGGQTFGGHCPSLALFAGAWAEIVRIAPEGHALWAVGQERPDFVKALSAAVYAPGSDTPAPDLERFRVDPNQAAHWVRLQVSFVRPADAPAPADPDNPTELETQAMPVVGEDSDRTSCSGG